MRIWLTEQDRPMSMTCISLKPDRAKHLRISHPRPPAPLSIISRRDYAVLERDITTHDSGIYQSAPSSDMIDLITYRTLASSRKLIVSSPGTQSLSVNGPGRVRNLSRCFLRKQISGRSVYEIGQTSIPARSISIKSIGHDS